MNLTKYRITLSLALAALALVPLAGCNSGGTTGAKTTADGGPTTNPAPGGSGDSNTAARRMPTAEGNEVKGDKILIGIVASQNGELRPWGVDSINGAQLAVDEFNAAGGLEGKKVELRVGDSNSDATQGKSATEKLISEGVIGLVGEVSSGITRQMAAPAFDKGIPVVSIGATNPDITKQGANIFRVCYTDDFQGPVMAKFAFEQLNLRKVAMMTDKAQPYSTGLSDSFRAAFAKLGGEIVSEEFYESKQTNFGGQLTRLKTAQPDGLFLSGYFTETGPIARQAKEQGLDVPMFGGDGWDSSEILRTGGKAIIGTYFCNHYNNDEKRPEVTKFLAAWTAKYKAVPATAMGALAYDATILTLDALKRASALNSKALIAALEDTTDFQAISGKITLKGQNGNPPKRAIVVELTPKGQTFAKAYEANEVTQ